MDMETFISLQIMERQLHGIIMKDKELIMGDLIYFSYFLKILLDNLLDFM